jgi:hypothetical protein
MTENNEMVEVPAELYKRIVGNMDSGRNPTLVTEARALLPKPKPAPRLVAVDLDSVVRLGSHGEIMLYSELTAQPDLLTLLDEAVGSCFIGDGIGRDAYRVRRAIRTALGVDQ